MRRALLVLMVGLLALPVATSDAVTTGRTGMIAFDSRRFGDADVFVGSQMLAASVRGANDARPTWAPHAEFIPKAVQGVGPTGLGVFGFGMNAATGVRVDGRVLPAVEKDSFRVVVDISGLPTPTTVCAVQHLGILSAPGMTASAGLDEHSLDACDSQPIAFQSDRTGDYDIWVTDPAEPIGPQNPVNVTRNPGAHETAPAWSPARRGGGPTGLIAFESDRFGSRDIFVVDLKRPLGADNPVRVTAGPGDEANPDWSPNGRRIIFESDRDGPKDIWSVAVPDEGPVGPDHDLRQHTADLEPSFDPTWGAALLFQDETPGGSIEAIAFSGPEVDAGDCEVNLITSETDALGLASEMRTIVSPSFAENAPVWAPMGSPLTFQSVRGGNEDLYAFVTEARSSDTPVRLTSDPAPDRHPSYQPLLLTASLTYIRPVGTKTKRKPRPKARAAAADARPCAQAPEPGYTFSPGAPERGERVRFDAGDSRDGEGPIDHYEWDLDGDGTFEARGRTVERSFPDDKVYDVVLRVVDQDGAPARLRRRVPVGRVKPQECTSIGTPGPDVLRGTSGDDVLCGLGGDDVLYGEGGNDVVVGGAGADKLFGGVGEDRLAGGDNRDELNGDAGDDRLDGGSDNDRMAGGEGVDVLVGGAGDDTLAGNGGKDRLVGDGGSDTLRGGVEADRLEGGDQADTLHGNSGDDELAGGAGDDTLIGGAGKDVLGGDRGRDLVLGDAGNDRLAGGPGGDDLLGGADRDRVSGEAGSDSVAGDDGSDTLTGGIGNDRIAGGRGNDTATGGGGQDRVAGNASADALSGGPGNDSLVGGSGKDTLRGDAGRDMLSARDRRRDRVIGGPQRDRALVDRGLDAVGGVEALLR